MDEPFTILAIPGSLRKGSYNRAALKAAQELAPPGVRIEIADLKNIPPYNQDTERNPPDAVRELKERIRAADAILFATPEYNYSVSGVLKNAIDWVSRPRGDNAWDEKPVAIMGASTGQLGTARAQYHLRQSLISVNMHPLNRPEVMIAVANTKFDEHGNLTDEQTRRRIGELLNALVVWAKELRKIHID
jgi:chromate reductase